jgi:hypothetical protein
MYAVLLMHVATNYVLVVALQGGYLAAGVAYSLSRFYYFVLQVGARSPCDNCLADPLVIDLIQGLHQFVLRI